MILKGQFMNKDISGLKKSPIKQETFPEGMPSPQLFNF